MITQQQDLMISVDGSKQIYVGETARAAIREDARTAFDQRIRTALKMWETVDLDNLEGIKQVQFELACARDCIDALKCLAPIPEDDDDE